jgi:hypothetical protein
MWRLTFVKYSEPQNKIRQSAGQSGAYHAKQKQQVTHWLPGGYLQFSKSVLNPHQNEVILYQQR